MTDEQLFLETIADLRKRLDSGTDYDYLRACGLLRHLLVDGSRLMDLAKKDVKLKIRFEVKDRSKRNATKFVDVDAFLKEPALRYQNLLYNVYGIIYIVSNRLGGVHSIKPKDTLEYGLQYLKSLKRETAAEIMEKDSLSLAIIRIANSTLEALAPLEKALTSRRTLAGGF